MSTKKKKPSKPKARPKEKKDTATIREENLLRQIRELKYQLAVETKSRDEAIKTSEYWRKRCLEDAQPKIPPSWWKRAFSL